MGLYSIAFPFEEAGQNIRRNGLMSLAALTTVTIAMAVLGGALFSLYRLHQFADTQPRQFEVAVFIRTEVERDKVLEVQQRVKALPNVASVNLVTKEQALQELQQTDASTGSGIAEALTENPLPDRLDIRLVDPAKTGILSALLRDGNQFPEIETVRDARETLNKLLATSRLVTNVGGVAAIMLFLATAFVIQNTIRLTVFARRREIRIMQLVGATPAFIRRPLVLEGIFYGSFGAAVAGGLVLFVAHQLSAYTSRFDTPLGNNMPSSLTPSLVLVAMVGLGAFVGWAGSMLSIRRFLKKV